MRLRVATLFTALGIGGDENRVLAFAAGVDRARFDHRVVTLTDWRGEDQGRWGPIVERYRALGVRVATLGERRRVEARRLPRPLSLARDGVRTARIVGRLASWLRTQSIDVVDARMNYALAVGLAAGRLAGCRVIGTEYADGFWSRAPWRQVARPVLAGLDALVSDSAFTIHSLRRELDHPLPRARVVPNGVPAPPASTSRRIVRERLGLPAAARVIGQVARIVSYKGHRVLLAAAARVMAQEPDVWLLVCGYPGYEPELPGELAALAASLGIAERVRIAGWPGPIGDVWGAIDVHAHPSLLDSSPIAIHESMAWGLPLVASEAGGIPELVRDGETGLLVPVGDSAATAAALLRILREPALARRLGEAARARWQARHQPEQMTGALERLLQGAA